MHRSSFEKMAAFRDAYLAQHGDAPLAILDVGSAAVAADGASYRPLFDAASWRYTGLDMAPGPNVDVVAPDPYAWTALPDASVDVVVSGQAFEHIEWPWLTMAEIARVLRGNGLAAIIAPSAGPVHRFPKDCWRFYPDGLPALAAHAGLAVVEQHWDNGYAWPENAFWGESFVLLQRPPRPGEQPGAVFGTAASLEAVSRCATQRFAELSPWRVKAALLREALHRIRLILRLPIDRLPRL
jgi:SAM-dependent methyltransferase